MGQHQKTIQKIKEHLKAIRIKEKIDDPAAAFRRGGCRRWIFGEDTLMLDNDDHEHWRCIVRLISD